MPYIELVNFRPRLFQLAPLVLYDFDTVRRRVVRVEFFSFSCFVFFKLKK